MRTSTTRGRRPGRLIRLYSTPKDCEWCGTPLPLPRLRSQQFCPGRTCRQDAANYRRQTERFAARNGGASYDLYLAMRAVGVCNVCGKQHDNPTGLHSHCYGGQVLGVKCSDHNVDFAQVRRGMASPIGAMAEYLKAVFS